MTPEQLNRELTDLVTRARRLLTEIEVDLSRDAQEPKTPVVPLDPPLRQAA
jgi:hypothetical protein